jgi:hypothetical protein
VILLDENIRQDQGTQLRQWRVRCRFLVEEFAPPGIQDPEIIPLLQRLKQPSFFTHDQDFFQRDLVHTGYSLVWLDVFDGEAATFIRLFLKHPLFNTSAKRMGLVARVHHHGVHFWQKNSATLQRASWTPGPKTGA